jgi:hypothetical protein
MKTRKEKIRLLNEIMEGKTNFSEIILRPPLLMRTYEGSNIYHCEQLKRDFTLEEYKTFRKKNPSYPVIIIERRTVTPQH